MLLSPLDPGELASLPDAFSFVDTFTPEVQAIEDQLSAIDIWLTAATALSIADIFLGIDSVASEFDGLVSDFTGFDFASPVTGPVSNAAGIDSALASGASAVSGAGHGLAAVPVTIPGIKGINVNPPQPPYTQLPTLPPVQPTPPSNPGSGLSVSLSGPQYPGSVEYKVGGAFVVTVKGPPGQNVYANSAHESQLLATAGFGTIDGSGERVIRGTWTVADRGNWVENWYVGTQFAGRLSFFIG